MGTMDRHGGGSRMDAHGLRQHRRARGSDDRRVGRRCVGGSVVGRMKDVKYVLLVVTAMALLLWASAVTVPNAFVAGEVISAAEMNANFDAVAAAISELEATVAATRPAASVVRQSLDVASNDPSWVPFGFTLFASSGMVDPAEPTRVTVPVDGIYLIATRVSWSNNVDGRRSATVFVNDSTMMSDQRVASGPSSNAVSGLRRLSAGDYVELRLFQNSGVDVNVNSAYLDVTWLGPAP
jgi:hypothetical protein